MTPEAKKMIRVIVRLIIILRVILRILCCFDLSHVLYFSKGPCCSLACGHRRISGRRFPSPKWVKRCDDRKYVCEHRLAVHKRHNFCSNSNSLATFITCNHFLRLGDPIQSAQKGFPTFPNPFKLPLQNLVLFQLFLRDSCADGTCDICQVCMFASTEPNLFEPYKQGQPTTVSS